MSTQNTPLVDIEKVKAEIAGLSSDQMIAELTKLTVRKKVQQKKHQGSDQQKAYQAKQRQKFALMKENALKLPRTDGGKGSLWDQINDTAETQAEAKVDEARTSKAANAAVGEEEEELETA